MSRQNKWELNRPIGKKTCQSFSKMKLNANEFQWNVQESISTNKNELILGKSENLHTFKVTETMPTCNNEQNVMQNSGCLNISKNFLHTNMEEINVWKSYKPVLDLEEPMDVDKPEIDCFASEKFYTEPNILEYDYQKDGYNTKKEFEFSKFERYDENMHTLKVSETMPIWNNEQHIMQNPECLNVNEKFLLSHMKEINAWKSYKPVLDPVEPMEIDEDIKKWPTHRGWNTECNVFESKVNNNHFSKSSMNGKDTNINVWKSYISVLDPVEPMDVDEPEIDSLSSKKFYTESNIRDYDYHKDSFITKKDFEFSKLESYQPTFDLRYPENFQEEECTTEIYLSSDDVLENSMSDAEFQEWLLNYPEMLNKTKSD